MSVLYLSIVCANFFFPQGLYLLHDPTSEQAENNGCMDEWMDGLNLAVKRE